MIASLLLVASIAQAEASPGCTVIVGGEIITPGERRMNSALQIDGERILSVSDENIDLEVCSRLELPKSSVITAGLIESHTGIGLVEVGMEKNTVDSSSNEANPVRAALRVADAYNPHSSLIPIARLGGISTAILVPSGGLVSGQGAAVDLVGNTQEKALVDSSLGIWAHLGGRDGSRAQTLLRLREILDDTRTYSQNKRKWENDTLHTLAGERLDLEALLPVVDGDTPLLLRAERAADIEAVLRLAEETGIRLVIIGGSEGWLLADRLAAANVPVILDPLVYGPGSFEQVHATAENAALLHKAGVPIIISSFSSHNARNIRQSAANAVRAGLPWEAAMAAITENPATVFGLSGRGVLVEGAVANVAIFSGDPLEASSHLQHLWIRGQSITLTSRQEALLEKYRELP